MKRDVYRYRFCPSVLEEEVDGALLLALVATEALHGEAQVRLDADHHLDPQRRACVIDASTPVGRDFNRLFTTFLRREFGEESFQVERLTEAPELAATA